MNARSLVDPLVDKTFSQRFSGSAALTLFTVLSSLQSKLVRLGHVSELLLRDRSGAGRAGVTPEGAQLQTYDTKV